MKTNDEEEAVVVAEQALVMAVPGPPPAGLVAADQNPAAVYLASLGSAKSRASQRSALDTIARELGAVTPSRSPGSGAPVPTRRRPPGPVRRAIRAGDGEPLALRAAGGAPGGDAAWRDERGGLRPGLRRPRGARVEGASRPPLDPGELTALFQACDVETNAGARDAALLALLDGAGLRRSEAVALDLEHVDAVTGALRVLGKGNKERLNYAPPGALRALRAWLARRGDSPGPLLLGVNKAGRLTSGRLSDRAVAAILQRLAKRAGVEAFTPHDLRRTMISDLLDAGGDISTVQRLAGHAQVTTTQRYDRRGERAKVRTAELLRVPFDG